MMHTIRLDRRGKSESQAGGTKSRIELIVLRPRDDFFQAITGFDATTPSAIGASSMKFASYEMCIYDSTFPIT